MNCPTWVHTCKKIWVPSTPKMKPTNGHRGNFQQGNTTQHHTTTMTMTTTSLAVSLYRSLNNRFVDNADDRQRMITFVVSKPSNINDQDDLLEWLFESTNAPESFLDEEQMFIRKTFFKAELYSISRGDLLLVNDELYKCKMVGWEKVSRVNDIIED